MAGLPPTNHIPVWVLSRNSAKGPAQFFPATQFWDQPPMWMFRIKPRNPRDPNPPECRGGPRWEDIKDLIFSKDPRLLARYKGVGKPMAPPIRKMKKQYDDDANEGDEPKEPLSEVAITSSPTLKAFAKRAREDEAVEDGHLAVPVTPEVVVPVPQHVEQSAAVDKPLPDRFATPMADAFAKVDQQRQHQQPPTSDMTEKKKVCTRWKAPRLQHPILVKLAAFASEGAIPRPPSTQLHGDIFTTITDKVAAGQKMAQEVKFYSPESTRLTQRNAMRRFIEMLSHYDEILPESLSDAGKAGKILDWFFVVRSQLPDGHPPTWSSVKALTALHETYLVATVLQETGFPKPDMQPLRESVRKLPDAKKSASESTTTKAPLRIEQVVAMWRSQAMESPCDLRNIAMFTIGFFFLLRGVNVRELKKEDVTYDSERRSWSVWVDHQKNDPLVLGRPGTAKGALKWAGNQILDEILLQWLEVTKQLEGQHFWFPQASIHGNVTLSWRGRSVRFTSNTHLQSSQHLNDWVQGQLTAAGLKTESGKITFHSARVGGASAIYALTRSETYVRKMGSWKSNAFQIYISLSVKEITESTLIIGQAATSSHHIEGEPELA